MRLRLPAVLTRNVRLKALALGLAVVIWGGVVYAGNPPQTRTVAVHVPQDAAMLPGQYLLAAPIADVSLSISGTREHLDGFDAHSIQVSADYQSIKGTGPQQLPVKIVNNDRNVELDSPPDAVTADVDEKKSATIGVQIEARPPPAGYAVNSSATRLTPAAVTVTGPARELSGLRAVVQPDLENWKTNYDAQLDVVLINQRGARVGDVGVQPASVLVSLQITSTLTDRAVAVVPQLNRSSVGRGYQLSAVSVDPPIVTVHATQDLLSGLNHVQTELINLAGATGSQTFAVRLSLPPGVTADVQTVTVNVGVVPIATPSPPTTATPKPT